ncbi:PadR family transcriptional regulator [Baekduia sp.]|uniref:PadR family transcriptional regulator n=1 Tax=Baekduia sp. TaxID=2600305 RepID=UPI0039C8BA4E
MIASPKGGVVSESTRYAVLGLLARRPTHGYALVEQIRRWPLDPVLVPTGSSIYKALRRLSHEQLIEPLDSGPGRGAGSAWQDDVRCDGRGRAALRGMAPTAADDL